MTTMAAQNRAIKPPHMPAQAVPSMTDQFMEVRRLRHAGRESRHARLAPLGAATSVTPRLPTPAETSEPVPDSTSEPVVHHGDEYECSLSMDSFKEGQRAARHRCRHCFHAECWDRTVHSWIDGYPNCPGDCMFICVWSFIGPSLDPTHGQPYFMFVDQDTEVTRIETPRSMMTEQEFTTPNHEQYFQRCPCLIRIPEPGLQICAQATRRRLYRDLQCPTWPKRKWPMVDVCCSLIQDLGEIWQVTYEAREQPNLC